jgi:hypothetical protein
MMNGSRLEKDPQWLKAFSAGRPVGVDREKKVLRGFVVAQLGPFKSGRGQFDDQSLDQILTLMQATRGGLKSRFAHPTLSGDGLGKFLGRVHNPLRDGPKVRADLHFDATSLDTPPEGGKALGLYVMQLAESDPSALSSSLVLNTDKLYQTDESGRVKRDEQGNEIPPVWRPTRLHASDIVDTGDAVDELMSVQLDGLGLPDHIVRQAAELLDTQFGGAGPEVIRARTHAWLESYLTWRFGEAATQAPTPPPAEPPAPPETKLSWYTQILRHRLRLKELAAKGEN